MAPDPRNQRKTYALPYLYRLPLCLNTPSLSLRKLQPQRLFTGNQLLGSDQVLLVDDQGTIVDIVSADNAGEGIEQLSGWLSPAFVNAHCHLELSHLKGRVQEKTGLPGFVREIINSRDLNQEHCQEAMRAADREMWEAGIQAVGDICNRIDSLHVKNESRITYYNFIEVSGWLPQVADKRYRAALEIMQAFSQVPGKSSLVPHAPYSVSTELWQLLLPQFTRQAITIHNQESPAEQLLFEQGHGEWLKLYEELHINNENFLPTGNSSLQSIFAFLQNAASLILVHNTYTTAADIEFAESRHPFLHWCLCPRANWYIEHTMPPVELLREHSCNIVLGTDSLASNHSLSLLDELKTLAAHFPAIPTEEMLTWATSKGAAALQLEDTLGKLTPGTRPGIIQIDALTPDEKINKATRVTRWW